MTLPLRSRLKSLLKRYPLTQILDTFSRICEASADECGQAGKDCRCYGGIQEQAYCSASRLRHEARAVRKCAGEIRCWDLEEPVTRSVR